MFENPRRGRQARNFTTNVPKIVDLKSSPEQIFSENCRWVPLSLWGYLVYAPLRQWSDRIRFDISLQNFKKPLDIFSPQRERKRSKEYLFLIVAVKESFERFSCLEFIFEKSKHLEAGLNINLSFKLVDSGFLETL